MIEPRMENNPYLYKWYDVDTTKLTSIKDIEAVFSAIGMKVSETNENFDKVKHLLIIPEEPKGIEYYQKELDEKFDALIKTTKEKFECSQYFAEKRYNREFDCIIQDFEYACKNGCFPHKLTFTVGDGLTANNFIVTGSSVESSFVIKQGKKHEGYYTFGNRKYFKFYMPDKPNAIVRFFMRTCLGFWWVDEKNAE